MISNLLHTNDLIAELATKLDDILAPLLPVGKPCALLDFPAYANVGDSAIWLGEIEYLRKRKVPIVYACDIATYSPTLLADRLGGGTILLSGGGNFGDLWPHHQRFRQAVVRDFPNNPIVQLPQSIHFGNQQRIAEAQGVFNAHQDMTLLLRDHQSLEFARTQFSGCTILCPDMAFALGQIERPEQPATDVVWLGRTDAESAGAAVPPTRLGVERVDWLVDAPSARLEQNRELSAQLHKVTEDRAEHLDRLLESYEPLARERLLRGCRMLSRGSMVITDRLHGHILCLLLGIPHVVLDNSYGKVKGFFDAWTHQSPLARWASTPAEALEIAEAMLEADGHVPLMRSSEPSPSGAQQQEQLSGGNPWLLRLQEANREIQAFVPATETFILVDQDELRHSLEVGSRAIPFMEEDGQYNGPPSDDKTAVSDVERLREAGAGFIAFAWPAFWWLEHYRGLRQHLRASFSCVLENERLVIFDLRAAGCDSKGNISQGRRTA